MAGKKTETKPGWQKRRFLLNPIECPHKKVSEHFHNGSWYVWEEYLSRIMARLDAGRIEENPAKRSLCLLCGEKDFRVLSYRVERYEEYTPYEARESALILPSLDFFVHYFEFKLIFAADKKKAVFESIENKAPRNIRHRSGYYESQLKCFDFLKAGNGRLIANGHFTVCAEHNTPPDLDEILRRITGIALGEKHGFHFYPWLGNEIISVPDGLDNFMKTHFSRAEIETRVISGQNLVQALDKKNIFIFDFH